MDTPLLSTFFGEVDRGLSPFAPVLSASKRRPATSPALTALHGRARGASSGGGGRESLVGGFLSNSRGSKPPGFGPGPLTQLQQSGSSSPPSRISLSRFCRVPLQQACAFSALIRAQRALVAAMILLLPASLSLRRLRRPLPFGRELTPSWIPPSVSVALRQFSASAFSMRRALAPSRSETRLDNLICVSSSRTSS
jgi:hypothetical protein